MNDERMNGMWCEEEDQAVCEGRGVNDERVSMMWCEASGSRGTYDGDERVNRMWCEEAESALWDVWCFERGGGVECGVWRGGCE